MNRYNSCPVIREVYLENSRMYLGYGNWPRRSRDVREYLHTLVAYRTILGDVEDRLKLTFTVVLNTSARFREGLKDYCCLYVDLPGDNTVILAISLQLSYLIRSDHLSKVSVFLEVLNHLKESCPSRLLLNEEFYLKTSLKEGQYDYF